MRSREKKEVSNPISFQKMFLLFIVFSFIGCLYEDLLFMTLRYLETGRIIYITARGLLYFELSPIYGFGACLMIGLLSRKEHTKSEYFLFGALIGGFFEYMVSYLQETFTGTISWDYSNHLLNIGGRTTIPIMFFWGLLCLVLMTKVYPYVSLKIDKFLEKYKETAFKAILVVIVLDMILSFSACIRLGLRQNGFKPFTFYGIFLDTYYDDERMSKSYTNMVKK